MLYFNVIKSIAVYRDSDLAVVRGMICGRSVEICRIIKLGNEMDPKLITCLNNPEVTRVYDRTPDDVVRVWRNMSQKYNL